MKFIQNFFQYNPFSKIFRQYPSEQLAYLRQQPVDTGTDDPQRLIGWHEVVQPLDGEQAFGEVCRRRA